MNPVTLDIRTTEAFLSQFGDQPTYLVRAPGRVNLIGEHTDYNDGFVMPMAIEQAVWIALRPRTDRRLILTSLDMGETAAFHLDDISRRQPAWIEYVKGVAWALQEKGFSLAGWEGVLAGDVPMGAGLSSSAAVEMATARAFAVVSQFDWHPVDMARAGQLAENQWIGLNSGIMDQMISAGGQAGHTLLIDCRSLAMEAVPLPENTAVAILDTNTRRGLAGSAYNERRQQCEIAAAYLNVPALRDVTLETLKSRGAGLDDIVYRRARHVITENERVLHAQAAMLKDDPARLGQLMDSSHRSMRDDFEISSPALDTMVGLAQDHSACYGARMTGGGFAGCAVALIEANDRVFDDFVGHVEARYQAATNLSPNIYVCRAAAGASLEEIPHNMRGA